jgi:hypothetical protein
VHELSSALQRRFNVVRLPLPASLEEELKIVTFRIQQIADEKKLPHQEIGVEEIKKLITVFRELRSGKSEDGELKIKSPTATLSTAEAISAVNNSMVLSAYFNYPKSSLKPIAESIISASIKDPTHDLPILEEYLDTVLKAKKGYTKLFEACKEILHGRN